MPFNRQKEGGGFPAAQCGIVSRRGSKGMDEGKEKVEGNRKTSIGQFLNDHWESGLGRDSQHINLDLRRGKRLVSFNSALISKHHEACNSNTTDGFL